MVSRFPFGPWTLHRFCEAKKINSVNDDPLSLGLKLNTKKIDKAFVIEVKNTKRRIALSKTKKYLNRAFWGGSILFVLWVSTGFYDLFPRIKLDERYEEYKRNKNIRYQLDNLPKEK